MPSSIVPSAGHRRVPGQSHCVLQRCGRRSSDPGAWRFTQLGFLGGGDSTTAGDICSSLIGATLGANAGNCSGMTAANCVAAFQTPIKRRPPPSAARRQTLHTFPISFQAAPGYSGALAPNYRTPYSIQMNGGIQRELRPGMVLSVDYLRNVALHYLIGVDANHSGDVRYFNKSAAQQAISATNYSFGCTGGNRCSLD